MNCFEIEDLLPHRHPFLFLDTVDTIEPGKRGIGRKIFSPDDHIFRGSSIRPPIVPSGILIEAMAQLAAVVCAPLDQNSPAGEKIKPEPGYLIAIQLFEYLEPVSPGEMIILEVEITLMFGPMVKCRSSATIGKTCVARAELSFRKNID